MCAPHAGRKSGVISRFYRLSTRYWQACCTLPVHPAASPPRFRYVTSPRIAERQLFTRFYCAISSRYKVNFLSRARCTTTPWHCLHCCRVNSERRKQSSSTNKPRSAHTTALVRFVDVIARQMRLNVSTNVSAIAYLCYLLYRNIQGAMETVKYKKKKHFFVICDVGCLY